MNAPDSEEPATPALAFGYHCSVFKERRPGSWEYPLLGGGILCQVLHTSPRKGSVRVKSVGSEGAVACRRAEGHHSVPAPEEQTSTGLAGSCLVLPSSARRRYLDQGTP